MKTGTFCDKCVNVINSNGQAEKCRVTLKIVTFWTLDTWISSTTTIRRTTNSWIRERMWCHIQGQEGSHQSNGPGLHADSSYPIKYPHLFL